MKRILLMLIGAMGVAVLSAGPHTARGEFSESELNTLVEELERDAKQWVEDGKTAVRDNPMLRNLKYDEQILPALHEQLVKARTDPEDLYVINQLLRPLQNGESDLIVKMLPLVQSLTGRAGFRQFLPAPPGAALVDKDGAADGPPPAPKTEGEKRRVETDRTVALHNAQAAALLATYARLMLYADQDTLDERLIEMMKQQEKEGNGTFLDIVAMIRSEARQMNVTRGKRFYDGLMELGLKLRDERKVYTDYSKPVISPLGSYYPPKDPKKGPFSYPGILLLEAANQYCPVARVPALKVPAPKEIDAKHGDTVPDKPAPRNPGRRRGSPG